MKKVLVILVSIVMLLACGNKRSEKELFINEPVVEEDSVYDDLRDTLASKRSVDEGVPPRDARPHSPHPRGDNPPPKPPMGGRHGDNPPPPPPDDDNMRGFDPASEDDMPDNGMSRYMENNDEEGWN